MRLTIRDVAKKLNLSITTVSRALDGYADVANDTRKLVIETAREMGYTPNRAARQLRRQKAETIGFILPAHARRFDEPFFAEFIAGLGNELSGKNFDLLVSNAADDEMEHRLYQRWVSSRKVDGFILNRVSQKDWRVQFLAREGIPFSALGMSQDGLNYPHIRIDGLEGFVELVRHLQQGGFSRFAFIGGRENLINHIDRLGWFKAALAVCGLPFDQGLVFSSDMTSTGGYEVARRLFALPRGPDALLCISDETAFGALHAAHERGLAVGRDIAIAGFEGVQDSRHTEPPLTTLDIPVEKIARQLVTMLLAKLNGETLERDEIVIHPTLLIRASTGG